MTESWLDKSHRYAKEEFEIPLKKVGFKKYGNSLIRNINGKEQLFRLQWTPFGSRKHNLSYFWFVGDDIARKYIFLGLYYCAEDIVQVYSFIGSGNDDFAEKILRPIGLYKLYKSQLSKLLKSSSLEPYCLSIKKYSKNISNYKDIIQSLYWAHRYRWSSEESFREILRSDLKSFLLFFDLAAKLNPNEKEFVSMLKKELKKNGLTFYG